VAGYPLGFQLIEGNRVGRLEFHALESCLKTRDSSYFIDGARKPNKFSPSTCYLSEVHKPFTWIRTSGIKYHIQKGCNPHIGTLGIAELEGFKDVAGKKSRVIKNLQFIIKGRQQE
jgi:hypothetical protein